MHARVNMQSRTAPLYTGRSSTCLPSVQQLDSKRAPSLQQRAQERRRIRAVPASHATSGGRNIVLAIDSSAQAEPARSALQYTLQHIYRPGDVLHLLHVLPSSASLFAAQGQCLASLIPEEGLQEQLAARARAYFQEHYMQLAQESGADVHLDLVHGSCTRSVSQTIIQKVDDLAAALVVLPVQKRSWMQELFQPPISSQVAQHCSRPTLVLHDTAC